MSLQQLKGLTRWQFWNHQVFRIPFHNLWGTHFSKEKGAKMNINYSNQGMVKFSMIINLYSVLQDFPEHLGETAANPDDEHILKGSDKIKTQDLLGDQAQTFHHTLSQLIFMSARTQKWIQTPVALLTTPVKKQEDNNWGKLRSVLKYLKGTYKLKTTLSIGDMVVVKLVVLTSYTENEYWWGHTGYMMSLGKGEVSSFSKKTEYKWWDLNRRRADCIRDA